MAKRKLPAWGIEAKKALIDRSMSVTKLAEEIGFSRVLVSSVISGRIINEGVKNDICSYLELDITGIESAAAQ